MCLNSSHKISASTYTKDKTPETDLQKYRGRKGNGMGWTQQHLRYVLGQAKQAKNFSTNIQSIDSTLILPL